MAVSTVGTIRRISFMVMGIACLILALIPSIEVRTKRMADGATETRRSLSLGVSRVPLLHIEESETKQGPPVPTPDGGLKFVGRSSHRSLNVGLISWSMLSLVAGAFLLAIPKNDPDHRHVADVGSQSR
jgi:hypothetical protein